MKYCIAAGIIALGQAASAAPLFLQFTANDIPLVSGSDGEFFFAPGTTTSIFAEMQFEVTTYRNLSFTGGDTAEVTFLGAYADSFDFRDRLFGSIGFETDASGDLTNAYLNMAFDTPDYSISFTSGGWGGSDGDWFRGEGSWTALKDSTFVDPSPVPLPASGFGLLAGLGLLSIKRLRTSHYPA